VCLDERSRDVEAKSQSLARRTSSERLENLGTLFGGNGTAVCHGGPHLIVAAPGAHGNRRLGVAVLDGIEEQILKDLSQCNAGG